ncbi:MAG: serine hydroxymethyltransferase [Planctomycetota bacterium]|nr:MAG: serine hydroxymethyltransferase [Planctomycetota bacterium]
MDDTVQRDGQRADAVLAAVDPAMAQILADERRRQTEQINLIASENTVSAAVLRASGSIFTNKYAEGYPGRRYYAGCEHVDRAERLAQQRARELFPGAEHVNVQPHSGSQANQAVQLAVLEPGDTILSMDLSQGGHLSHGHRLNLAGKLYRIVSYGVDRETERLDYDAIAEIARRCRPKLIIAGASAYSRVIDFAAFARIAEEVGALLLADIAHIAGLVATGLHPSPLPHADFVTTTTHKTLRGPRGGMILCREKFAKAIDRAVMPGLQGGPLCHQIAARAVAFREALTESFARYQRRIVETAAALAAALDRHGFRIVSGGTDNHLFLLDLRPRGLTGKVAEAALERAGIICNKNLIPYDPETPFVTSGIRIGTPTVASRGMDVDDMQRIADWIATVLEAPEDTERAERVRAEVARFAAAHPIAESYLEEAPVS